MLDSATETPTTRATVTRPVMAKCGRSINPGLIPPIVHFLEILVVILTGLMAILVTRNSSDLSHFICVLTVFTSISFSLFINSHSKLSAEIFVELAFYQRLTNGFLPIFLPISCVAAFMSIVEHSNNGIFAYLAVGPILWLWVMFLAIAFVILHTSITYVLRYWRNKGVLVQKIAIVGAGKHADLLMNWLKLAHPHLIEIVGVFEDRNGERAAELPLRHLVRGTIDDLLDLSAQVHIDRVLVALPHAAETRLLRILRKLRALPADITLAPDLIGFAALQESGPGLPLTDVYARPLRIGEQLLKTVFDRTVAAGLVILLLPVLLSISLAIYLESGRPILFRQKRYGLGHQIITVFKFRTMYSELSDHNCFQQTAISDPRTTNVGRWLRRLSLDELAQLFNVLRGNMSLVGPRPLAVEMRVEDKLNKDLVAEYCLRHRVKPGITGWAQIHGLRGAVYSREALQKRVIYDLAYIDNWSFWLDIRILASTVKELFIGRNAY
jgi:Undecaprenyl-phosphate glucose phosphotransferase